MTEGPSIMTPDSEALLAHTPGPWEYRPEMHDDWGVVRAGRYWIGQIKDSRYLDDDYLAQCRREQRDPWEANARLVAAAPDLLAALELAVSYGWQHPTATDAIAKARAQITRLATPHDRSE